MSMLRLTKEPAALDWKLGAQIHQGFHFKFGNRERLCTQYTTQQLRHIWIMWMPNLMLDFKSEFLSYYYFTLLCVVFFISSTCDLSIFLRFISFSLTSQFQFSPLRVFISRILLLHTRPKYCRRRWNNNGVEIMEENEYKVEGEKIGNEKSSETITLIQNYARYCVISLRWWWSI